MENRFIKKICFWAATVCSTDSTMHNAFIPVHLVSSTQTQLCMPCTIQKMLLLMTWIALPHAKSECHGRHTLSSTLPFLTCRRQQLLFLPYVLDAHLSVSLIKQLQNLWLPELPFQGLFSGYWAFLGAWRVLQLHCMHFSPCPVIENIHSKKKNALSKLKVVHIFEMTAGSIAHIRHLGVHQQLVVHPFSHFLYSQASMSRVVAQVITNNGETVRTFFRCDCTCKYWNLFLLPLVCLNLVRKHDSPVFGKPKWNTMLRCTHCFSSY